MSEIVNLDEIIEKMFPWSILAMCIDNDQAAKVAYKAYAQGFKDGYARRNPDVILQIVRQSTIGEMLNAAQQEGSEDQGSNAEVLRKEEG